jgi:hypothetical protein
MFSVCVVFDDGQRSLSENFTDLGDATLYALERADSLGKSMMIDGHGPPSAVEIREGDNLTLSIKIFPGGLLPDKAVPKRQSM